MAKVSIDTGETGQAVHTRTTEGAEESQAVVIGIDGSDAVLPVDPVLGMSVREGGAFGYAAGTSAATVDVPSGARVKRVSVIPGAGAATIVIAGGATITVPQGGGFDEQIPGQATAGGDVVIGGAVASYYVSWVS